MPEPVEPSIAALVLAYSQPDVDWGGFRKCGICRAETGTACRTAAGPAGPSVVLPYPHGFRRRLVGRNRRDRNQVGGQDG